MNGHVGEGAAGPVSRIRKSPAINSHVGNREHDKDVVGHTALSGHVTSPAVNGHVGEGEHGAVARSRD
jgi:hypothetical protein